MADIAPALQPLPVRLLVWCTHTLRGVDRQTRQAAISLYAEGWPMSEALRVAVEQKTTVLWQIGPIGALADYSSDSAAPPSKRPEVVPETKPTSQPHRRVFLFSFFFFQGLLPFHASCLRAHMALCMAHRGLS